MNKRKKLLFIAFILLLFVGGILMVVSERREEKSVQISMVVLNDKAERFYQMEVEDDTANFTLDILYQANYCAEFKMYVLSNFIAVPYSLNGGSETIVNKLEIKPSEDIRVSSGNRICVRGISERNNDFCIVLISETDTFTKRFQIVNKSNSVDHFSPEISTKALTQPMEQPYEIIQDFDNRNVTISIDFSSELSGSRYKAAFDKDDIGFNMAVAIYNEDTCAFELVGYAYITKRQFEFTISTKSQQEGDIVRYILFPFAHQYNDDFLSTYKMTLWSSPISIDRIRIGE